MKTTIDVAVLLEKVKKEIVYLEEMPKDLVIETSDMMIIGTGEKKKSPAVTELNVNAL